MWQLGGWGGSARFGGWEVGGRWGVSREEYRLEGVQVGLANDVMMGRLCGLQIGIGNTVKGWFAGSDVIVNGLQLGVVNIVEAPEGNVHGAFCQIGLLNIVNCSDATPYLPLLRVWW